MVHLIFVRWTGSTFPRRSHAFDLFLFFVLFDLLFTRNHNQPVTPVGSWKSINFWYVGNLYTPNEENPENAPIVWYMPRGDGGATVETRISIMASFHAWLATLASCGWSWSPRRWRRLRPAETARHRSDDSPPGSWSGRWSTRSGPSRRNATGTPCDHVFDVIETTSRAPRMTLPITPVQTPTGTVSSRGRWPPWSCNATGLGWWWWDWPPPSWAPPPRWPASGNKSASRSEWRR